MLLNLRDNMKGTLVVVVIILFVVPMVLTGVGSSFLGSASGTEAAKVEGKSISNSDVQRAVYMRRQQIVAQTGGDASADYLSDDNLRGPVLDGLVRRLALIRSAQNAGMGASDKLVNSEIVEQTDFHTDNKFDLEKYKMLLRGANYTPATYKEEVAASVLLSQQAFGLEFSSFVTDVELDNLIAIVEQKRSFYTVTIPQNAIDQIEVGEEELKTYFDLNQNDFLEPEKVKVEYLELSVSDIAKTIDVDEEEIKAQYEQEVERFEQSTRYDIAHILIEDNDESRVKSVSEKLDSGDAFDVLAKSFSDDIATKDSGGSLGVMTLGMFPSEFENAVLALEEGQVSAPVKTDSGTHFIKALKKITSEAPAYATRKAILKNQLATLAAEEMFIESLDALGEATFSSDGLADAAKQLGLSVKQSAYFERGFGTGIASEKVVRDVAYEDDTLINKHNSRVIEIGSDRALVLKVLDHAQEHVKEFSAVKGQISTLIVENKKKAELSRLSQELLGKIKAGGNAQELAEAANYTYKAFEGIKRQDVDVDRNVVQLAFSVIADQEQVGFETQTLSSGDYVLVAVTSVKNGDRDSLDEQQLASFRRQLIGENARFEGATFEAKTVETADVTVY